jgi:hypothetical protein
MTPKMRLRFWIDLGLSASSALCFLLTAVWTDWIELAVRIDPDNHDGSAEWVITGVSASTAILFALLSRREWRRAIVTS